MVRATRVLAIVSVMLVLPSGSSRSEWQVLWPNTFVAGVPTDQFEFYRARQDGVNWCWAACVQMVLNWHGLYVTQQQVVDRVYGDQVDLPASPDQILYALSGWAPDTSGRFSQIYANPYVLTTDQVINDLAYRWPLIVGLNNPNGGVGHAVVLTAVIGHVDPWGRYIIDEVHIRDPWPTNPSLQAMSWSEFQSRLNFITSVYVVRM